METVTHPVQVRHDDCDGSPSGAVLAMAGSPRFDPNTVGALAPRSMA